MNDQIAVQEYKKSEERFFLMVKYNDFYIKVDLKEVEYIESADKYLFFHVHGTRYSLRSSLSKFMVQYGDIFIRTHAKYAINKQCFVKLNYKENEVYLENARLPLSRLFRNGFYKYFSIKKG